MHSENASDPRLSVVHYQVTSMSEGLRTDAMGLVIVALVGPIITLGSAEKANRDRQPKVSGGEWH